MTYAAERVLYDADSHIMELPNFLSDFADPLMRDRIPAIDFSANSGLQRNLDDFIAQGGAHTEADVEKALALGDDILRGPKGTRHRARSTRRNEQKYWIFSASRSSWYLRR